MENRVLTTELVNWRELNDLQPKGFKINRNFEALKQSLKKYGFSLPFLAYKDTKNKVWVLDGHTRKEALQALILEGDDIPNELPCTFIDAKNKTEAGKLLLEVYNQKQNPIDGLFFDVFIKELEIDMEELDVEAINLHSYEVEDDAVEEGDDTIDYSGKNKEIDLGTFTDKMYLKLEYTEEEYNKVRNELSNRGITAEAALYNYLFDDAK